MARVPTSGNFSIMPAGNAGATIGAPSMQGITPGADLQRIGAAQRAVGETIGDIVLDQQQRANQTAVLDAENRAREAALRLTHDQNDGFANVRGRDVMNRSGGRDLYRDYDERYGRSIEEIGAGLQNDVQRQAFGQVAARLRMTFGADVQRHQASEYRSYQRSVYSGAINLAGQEIAANATNFEVIDEALERQQAAVAEVGALEGLSGNEITFGQTVARSRALRTAIAGRIDADDITSAEGLMARYGSQLTEEDRQAIAGPLQNEIRGRAMIESVDAVFNGVDPTEGAQIGGYMLPVEGGRISDEMGSARPGGRTHNGIDIAVPEGTPVRAGADGVIVRAWNDTEHGGGYSMRVRYDDGTEVGFAHLQGFHVTGGRVRRGQVVARSGNSGRSTGAHLHYTMRRDGQLVDPRTAGGGGAAAGANLTAEQAFNLARDAFMARVPNASPRDIEQLRQHTMARFAMREQAEEQAEESVMTEVQRALIANGGNFAALPARLRNRIPPNRYDDAMSFADRVRPSPPPRDPAADDRLYLQAVTDPAALAAMPDSRFAQLYAGHPNFNTLANLRAEQRNPPRPSAERDPGNLPTEAIGRAVNRHFSANGIRTNSTEPADMALMGATRASVDDAIIAEQRRIGRPMNDAEVNQFVDRLFLTDTVRFTRPFLAREGEQRARLMVRIDEIGRNDRAWIERRLREQNLPVTDANILRVYQSPQFPRQRSRRP